MNGPLGLRRRIGVGRIQDYGNCGRYLTSQLGTFYNNNQSNFRIMLRAFALKEHIGPSTGL